MSYCINPVCQQPQNQTLDSVCITCSWPLLLKDRYRALKRIGHGGFGRTLLAVDESVASKPRCVIKQFFIQGSEFTRPSDDLLAKATDLFHQEAQRLTDLGQHTQIPALVDFVDYQGFYYLVQDYIEGCNLEEELLESGPFSEAKIRQLLQNLLPVLHFVHSRHIIHRDLKPTNIIRRQGSPQLVLVDFGAARLMTGTALGRTGTMIGTAEYTAPEQLRGKATFASDLYSLGVTCLRLMTNVSPFELFDGENGEWIWRDFVKTGSISDTLAQVLNRMIQNATKQRFVSAYETLKALDPLQARFLQLSMGGDAEHYRESSALLPSSPTVIVPTTPWICTHTFQQTGSIKSLSLSWDSTLLVSGGSAGQLTVWDLNTNEWIHRLTGHTEPITSISLSADAQFCLSGGQDRVVSLWHVPTGQQSYCFNHHERAVTAVLLHPNGDMAISGDAGHRILLWDTQTGMILHHLIGHAGPIRSLAMTPSGDYLASGSEDATIRLWDLQTGALVKTIAAFYPIFSVAISANGRILAGGGYDCSLKIWDLTTGKLDCIFTDHANWVTCVDLSPDSHVVVSGSDDYSIKLRDLKSRKLFSVLMEHPGRISALQFGQTRQRLVSSCTEGMIKVWQQPSP